MEEGEGRGSEGRGREKWKAGAGPEPTHQRRGERGERKREGLTERMGGADARPASHPLK